MALPIGNVASASPWGAAIQAGGQVLSEAVKGDAKSGYANDGFAGMNDSGWTINFGGTMSDSGITPQSYAKPATSNQIGDLVPGFGAMGSVAGIPVEWLLIAGVAYLIWKR